MSIRQTRIGKIEGEFMALVQVNQPFEEVASIFESTNKDSLEKVFPKIKDDLESVNDEDIAPIKAIYPHLKEATESLGIDYKGKSFNIYSRGSNYGFYGPNIYSDGTNPIIEWGSEKHVLSGEFEYEPSGASYKIRTKTFMFKIPVSLEFSNDDERTQVVENWESSTTWEEGVKFMRERLSLMKKKQVLELDQTEFKIINSELKTGDSSNYFIVTLEGEDIKFNVFMNEETAPTKGKKVTLEKDELMLDGKPCMGSEFIKFKDLEVKHEYHVVKVLENTTHGGYILTIKDVESGKVPGNVNSNTQFVRWFRNQLRSGLEIEQVTSDNPINLQISSIKPSGQGYKAQLYLSMGNSESNDLASLFTSETSLNAEVSDSVENSESDTETETEEADFEVDI